MRQPLFAFLGFSCGVPPRQIHEINAVCRRPAAGRKKCTAHGLVRRGRPEGVPPGYSTTVHSGIMAGSLRATSICPGTAIHTSRGGTPFGTSPTESHTGDGREVQKIHGQRSCVYRPKPPMLRGGGPRSGGGVLYGGPLRDFITAHPSIMAGFYELKAICHENWVYTGFTAGRLLAVPYEIAYKRRK